MLFLTEQKENQYTMQKNKKLLEQAKTESDKNYLNSVEARSDLYKELGDRITKVKLAVAAQYGKSSNEYKDVVQY
jgi:hypothetical protein